MRYKSQAKCWLESIRQGREEVLKSYRVWSRWHWRIYWQGALKCAGENVGGKGKLMFNHKFPKHLVLIPFILLYMTLHHTTKHPTNNFLPLYGLYLISISFTSSTTPHVSFISSNWRLPPSAWNPLPESNVFLRALSSLTPHPSEVTCRRDIVSRKCCLLQEGLLMRRITNNKLFLVLRHIGILSPNITIFIPQT